MKRFLILGGFLLGAALLAPADDHDRRYYDRDHHDYHTYNSQEDRAYRVYLTEQHRDYREFKRNNHSEQQRYFRWRHDHPDHLLFKVEVH